MASGSLLQTDSNLDLADDFADDDLSSLNEYYHVVSLKNGAKGFCAAPNGRTECLGSVEEFRERRSIFVLGTLLQVVFFMEALLVSPHLSDIAEDLGIDPRDRDFVLGGGLQLCIFFTAMPFSLVIGHLGDNYNRKKIIVTVSVIGLVANLSMVLVRSYTSFLIVRTLTSLSCASSNVFSAIIATLYREHERVSMIGIFNAALGVGIGIGVFVSVSFGGHGAWRVPFLIIGTLQAAVTVLFGLKMPNVSYDAHPKSEMEPTSCQNVSDVCYNTNNLFLLAQGLFAGVPVSLIGVFMLDTLNVEAGAPSKFASLIIVAFFGLGLIIGQVNVTRIMDHFQIKIKSDNGILYLFIAACYIIPILPLQMVWFSDFSWMMTLGTLFSGVLCGINMILIRTLLMNCNRENLHVLSFSCFALADGIGRGPGVMMVSFLISDSNRQSLLSQAMCIWMIPGIMFAYSGLRKVEPPHSCDLFVL